MATPSLRAQIGAVRIALQHVISLAKAHGMRGGAPVDLLRGQLTAATETLERLEREGKRDGRV